MPYQWTLPKAPRRAGVPDSPSVLRLWPHRSLPQRGFAAFISVTAVLAGLPLLTILGHPIFWVLLPFPVVSIAGTWVALRHTYGTAEVAEEMRLWDDHVTLVRIDRQGERRWDANPHWVRSAVRPHGGPVPQYLTLSGAGRTVELGAFLSEDERLALHVEVERALLACRGSGVRAQGDP